MIQAGSEGDFRTEPGRHDNGAAATKGWLHHKSLAPRHCHASGLAGGGRRRKGVKKLIEVSNLKFKGMKQAEISHIQHITRAPTRAVPQAAGF
jgi:hypothetical protein